jgi:predicted DNA-binding protein
MRRTTFRCRDNLLAALDKVADETGINRSELLREGARYIVDAYDDGELLDDDTRRLLDREQVIDDAEATQKVVGLPSRIHNALARRYEGGAFPPDLARQALSSYRDEVDALCSDADRRERFHRYLDRALLWYQRNWSPDSNKRPPFPDAALFFDRPALHAEVDVPTVGDIPAHTHRAVERALRDGKTPQQVRDGLGDYHDNNAIDDAIRAVKEELIA